MLLCSLHVFAFIHCGTFTWTFVRRVSKKLAVFPFDSGIFCQRGRWPERSQALGSASSQWIFQLPPKRWDRDYITPQKAIYKWYILPIGWLYATYHLSGEPETTIDQAVESVFVRYLNSEVCRYFAVIASLRPLRRRQNWPSRHSWSPSTVSRSLCQFHFSRADSTSVGCNRRAQDGRWEKETEMSKSLRGTDEQTTYDLLWLFAGSSSFHLISCTFGYSGLTATAIFSSQLASLSVVECWCPASFVEPLWSSLLSKALHISLHGG